MPRSATPESRTPTPTVGLGAHVGSHSGSTEAGGALEPPPPSNSPPPSYDPLSDDIVVGGASSSTASLATASTVTVNNPPPTVPPPPYPSQGPAWRDLPEVCGEGEHQFKKYPTGNAIIYAVIFFPFGLLWLCWNREDICKRCGCHQGDTVALQDIRSSRRNPRDHTGDTTS